MLNSVLNARVGEFIAALSAFLLVGCEGQVTVDLMSAPPADPQVQEVVVTLAGVEFRRSGGDTRRLEFTEPELVDLMEVADGDAFRLFTDEELPEGTYTGIRLILEDDDNGFVTLLNGTEFPLIAAEGEYAEINFSIEDDEDSDEFLTLTIELRQSLRFEDDQDEYSLVPVLRSVSSDDAGQISGVIAAACPQGGSLLEGGAVYLFRGRDVTPDDVDGAAPEPYASAVAVLDTAGATFGYFLDAVPAGEYTIALTCEGHEDDPTANDDLRFVGVASIELERRESLLHDIE